MGVKFSAACTLDCTEHMDGVPSALCSTSGDGSDGLFPHPKTSKAGVTSRDITFNLLDGDFKVGALYWCMYICVRVSAAIVVVRDCNLHML